MSFWLVMLFVALWLRSVGTGRGEGHIETRGAIRRSSGIEIREAPFQFEMISAGTLLRPPS